MGSRICHVIMVIGRGGFLRFGGGGRRLVIIVSVGGCRIGYVGEKSVVKVLGVFQESLVDLSDEVSLATLLETGASTVVVTGGVGGPGSLAMGGTGLGDVRAVPDVGVVMILGRVCFTTDVASLGVEPSLPVGVRSSGGRGWRGVV
jgi:hypothetical protein